MSKYGITICLKSNLHIGSGFGFARIIDHVSIKDAEGLVYIPGSSIKGKLRSTCRRIALTMGDEYFLNSDGQICQTLDNAKFCRHSRLSDRCAICRMFGSPFTEGRLVFSDARLQPDETEKIKTLLKINPLHVSEQNEFRNSVKLSRVRRVSDPKHLFTLENVSKELKFEGVIQVRDDISQLLTQGFIKAEEELLKYGLRALTHLGGQKSRGLGRIDRIHCPELGL